MYTVPKVLKHHKGKKFQPGLSKFALVYIDCNAYSPAISAMEHFLPYMIEGAMFVIDEKQQGGETQAIMEFAKKYNLKAERFGGNEVPLAVIVK